MRRTAQIIASTFVALLMLSPSRADDGAVDLTAFQQRFLAEVGGALDAEIAALEGRLATEDLSESERDTLTRQLDNARARRRYVEDAGTVETLFTSLQDGYRAISDLAAEVESGYGGESAMNAAISVLAELRQGNRLQQLTALADGVEAGLGYYDMLKSLRAELADLDQTELSPGTRTLAKQLTVLTSLMSQFADKAPLVGAFLKAYGDVGGGVLKAAVALDGRIRALEQGHLDDGVHGVQRGEMLKALRKLDYDSAIIVEGLRDAYIARFSKGRGYGVVIWDRPARRWVESAAPHPSASELRRRYAFYVARGVPNPSPHQILTAFTRTLDLELTPSRTHIAPGETIELTVTGRLVIDDRPVGNLHVDVALSTHTGLGAGTFLGPTKVRLGSTVRWQAPNNINETYTFEGTLDPDSAAVGWELAGPAIARIRTGSETRVTLEASPRVVGFGDSVPIEVRVLSASGRPLDANAGGFVRVEAEGGHFRDYEETTPHKGLRRTWIAPEEAGVYVLRGVYDGATAYNLFGLHTASAEASLTIEVQAPRWSVAVSPKSASVDKVGDAASFEVSFTSEEDRPLSLVVGGDIGPATQRAHWSWDHSCPTHLELTPRGRATCTVTVRPQVDEAVRLAVRVRARLARTQHLAAATFLTRREAQERQITVTSRGQSGKARAGGQEHWTGTLKPGELVHLTFEPWGAQREFCVKGIIARNKGMRQVKIQTTGPNGCAWGTRDGRMSASWKVESETVRWSGPVTGAGTRATFVVPDAPGTFTISAEGETRWSYHRRAPGGTERKSATDKGRATFSVEVR